jgi:hypothetical protein
MKRYNDMSANALLIGSDASDASIVQLRQCTVDVLKILYKSGARNFVMGNVSEQTLGRCVSSSPSTQILPLDLLHPSQQFNRIVAREMTAVMMGEDNQWTTWLS